MIKIRLARGGRLKKPVYTIVAADSRFARDGRFIEKLGQYDPHAETVLSNVNVDSIKKWLSEGAVLSDSVRTLLKRSEYSLS